MGAPASPQHGAQHRAPWLCPRRPASDGYHHSSGRKTNVKGSKKKKSPKDTIWKQKEYRRNLTAEQNPLTQWSLSLWLKEEGALRMATQTKILVKVLGYKLQFFFFVFFLLKQSASAPLLPLLPLWKYPLAFRGSILSFLHRHQPQKISPPLLQHYKDAASSETLGQFVPLWNLSMVEEGVLQNWWEWGGGVGWWGRRGDFLYIPQRYIHFSSCRHTHTHTVTHTRRLQPCISSSKPTEPGERAHMTAVSIRPRARHLSRMALRAPCVCVCVRASQWKSLKSNKLGLEKIVRA